MVTLSGVTSLPSTMTFPLMTEILFPSKEFPLMLIVPMLIWFFECYLVESRASFIFTLRKMAQNMRRARMVTVKNVAMAA